MSDFNENYELREMKKIKEPTREELEKMVEKAQRELQERLDKMTPEEREQFEINAKKLIENDRAYLNDLIQSASKIAAPQENRPKFCPNCGAPVSGGNFCMYCGGKL